MAHGDILVAQGLIKSYGGVRAVRERRALRRPMRPLARPAATCRLTNAGRPVARA